MTDAQKIIGRCADNTAPPERYKEQGIFYFARTFFPEVFRDEFAIGHNDIVQMLFSLYDARKRLRIDRQAYVLGHRELAKSTIDTFLLPLYLICLKGHRIYWRENHIDGTYTIHSFICDEKFIIIASETATQSERFVSDLRATIDTNGALAEVFGELKPSLVDMDDERSTDYKWTQSAFVTSNRVVIWGVGAGQQIRGIKVNLTRPTLIIVDDMYSRKNTITETNREKLSYWFHQELTNSADSQVGKILWVGTMVHPDTVVKDMRQNSSWIGVERPIISNEELALIVAECLDEDGNVLTKKCEELQENLKTLSWKERLGVRFIAYKYSEEAKRGKLNYFYQEYMNEVVAPENKMITTKNFHRLSITMVKDNDGLIVAFKDVNGVEWNGKMIPSVGLDPAASQAKNADDTVFAVVGYAKCYPKIAGLDTMSSYATTPDGKIFPMILHIEGGKYAIHEFNKLPGMAQTLRKLNDKYNPKAMYVETNGQQSLIVQECRRYFAEQNVQATLVEVYNTADKAERILNTIFPIIQKHEKILVHESVSQNIVERIIFQTLTIGFGDHDDYPDALAIAFAQAKQSDFKGFNTNRIYEDEEYVPMQEEWLWL